MAFTHQFDVRYLEADQQGVVFNMWYLAYFDDAFTALLAHHGLPYQELIAQGWDAQLVHTEIDWSGPLRWGDQAAVEVALARLGTTSFALQFAVLADGTVVATGETVYVAVETDGWTTIPVPEPLRAALGPLDPLR